MDLSIYLGQDSKINEVSIAPPPNVRSGPDIISPRAGERFHLTENRATKLSNTTVGTLRQGVIQFVRVDPLTQTLANWVPGRPVFWSDIKKFVATTVAATTALLAGIAINTPDTLGDYVFIYVEGDVGGLYDGTLTKATPALNDPVVLKIASSLATLDVFADATSWTNVQRKLSVGRVNETVTAGAVKRIILTDSIRAFNEGMM